ncbi:MAG: hypothetical protein XD56_1065, partial [Pseudothermotoga lettingae]
NGEKYNLPDLKKYEEITQTIV